MLIQQVEGTQRLGVLGGHIHSLFWGRNAQKLAYFCFLVMLRGKIRDERFGIEICCDHFLLPIFICECMELFSHSSLKALLKVARWS